MNPLLHLVGLALIACVGCSPADPSRSHQQAAASAQTSSVPDRPVYNLFPSASEVRLFVETGYRGNESIFNPPRGIRLSRSQRAVFESALAIHTISPDEMFAACFIPHHFFRYFDTAGKLLGEVEVCFCCAGVQQSGASHIKLQRNERLQADFKKLEALVRLLGARTDVQCERDL